MPGLQIAGSNALGEVTEVLQLMNMVTEDELLDDEEYEGYSSYPISYASVDNH